MEALARALGPRGFAWIRGGDLNSDGARELARSLIEASSAADGGAELELIADYVLPPADGQDSREFQTLHFDFGIPLDPRLEHDIGRYTALYIGERGAGVPRQREVRSQVLAAFRAVGRGSGGLESAGTMPSDEQIMDVIDKLEAERSELRQRESGADPTLEADRARLEQIEVELDQLWDLRRQRQALRDAGEDPNRAHERSPDTVERYWQ